MTKTSAPTAEQLLERSDRAILRQLAYAAMNLKAAHEALAEAGTNPQSPNFPELLRNASAHLAQQADAYDVTRQVVAASGAADRNLELAGQAMAGDDSNLY